MAHSKKPKFLFNSDPWMLAEEIPDSDIFFFQIPMSCFASDNSYAFIKNYKKVLTRYKKFHMDFYFGQKDSFDVAESILSALTTRRGFGKDLDRNIVNWSQKLVSFAKATSKLPLKTYSNKQLWSLYDEHDRVHTKLYTYGWLPVSVDMFHNNFTKKLKSYLYGVCASKEQAEAAFITLTTPFKKTILAKEREEFLKIYKKYQSQLNKPTPALMAVLQKHSQRWGHLGYIYAGNVKPFWVEHYLKELRDVAATGISAERILKKEEQQLRQAKIRTEQLNKKLKISPLYRELFEAARDFALSKLVRRHAQLLDLYLMHNSLLPEIAKRLKRSRVQVQIMLYCEVNNALLNGKILSQRDLKIRFKDCVLYTEKNFETIYTGKILQKIVKTLKTKVNKNISEVTGQTAQPGYAKGTVKKIFRAKDMHKMRKGDILVSIATDPDIVPAMKMAGAIVTEQGGITSHAAIVSRELGIPCVIGTKIATKIFKDGDKVEVDANKGIVKKL
jgi:phosphohistidine swiveling domain-containing protein